MKRLNLSLPTILWLAAVGIVALLLLKYSSPERIGSVRSAESGPTSTLEPTLLPSLANSTAIHQMPLPPGAPTPYVLDNAQKAKMRALEISGTSSWIDYRVSRTNQDNFLGYISGSSESITSTYGSEILWIVAFENSALLARDVIEGRGISGFADPTYDETHLAGKIVYFAFDIYGNVSAANFMDWYDEDGLQVRDGSGWREFVEGIPTASP